jgi:hypothetical protein
MSLTALMTSPDIVEEIILERRLGLKRHGFSDRAEHSFSAFVLSESAKSNNYLANQPNAGLSRAM